MWEIFHFNEDSDWIDVEFMKREQTPKQIAEVVFSCTWL